MPSRVLQVGETSLTVNTQASRTWKRREDQRSSETLISLTLPSIQDSGPAATPKSRSNTFRSMHPSSSEDAWPMPATKKRACLVADDTLETLLVAPAIGILSGPGSCRTATRVWHWRTGCHPHRHPHPSSHAPKAASPLLGATA